MDKFNSESLIELVERFPTEQSCREYLSEIKWAKGYKCRKCGHDRYQLRQDVSRCCNICKTIESPTANTMFHRLRFGLRTAFMIIFEMGCSTKGMSASQISRRYDISRPTAHFFMHKVRSVMKSSKSQKVEGSVVVDEFVLGGKESNKQGRSYDTKKKKAVMAIQLTDERKVKRVYIDKIDDFSSASLLHLFEDYIDVQRADVITDKWRGYQPIIKKGYKIKQLFSDKDMAFKEIHNIIHQVKSTIRAIYSFTRKEHTQKYFDEYCFRVNRSQFKSSILHKLTERMALAEPQTWKQIMIST